MARKVEVEVSGLDKTKKFIEKNWPLAVTIAGAAGLVGASIWLTARYLREKKKRDSLYDEALRTVEKEVEATSSELAVILETGSFLGQISGDEGKQAIDELAVNTDSEEGKEAFQVLKEVIETDKKK